MSAMVMSIEEAMAKAQASAQGGAPAVVSSDPLLCDLSAWLENVAPPTWVVDGIVQRGYVYALTAITNHGKTAISLLMGLCIAANKRFAGKDLSAGAVLILCGENPDGFRTRLRATMQAMELTVADLSGRVVVLDKSLPLRPHLDQIKAEALALGVEFSLVLIDTSVSYFTGDSEDDNLQALEHARDMRELTELPGHPAVVANCHPTKGADRDNLLPRGGGAFLNEVDGNLTVWAEGETAELHWFRKKRGPDFDPIPFEFHGTTMDEGGVQVPTVVAWPISDARALELKRTRRENENRVLYAMLHKPEGTMSEWADMCGWDGRKNKSKVIRILRKLHEDALTVNKRGDWTLTKAGLAEAERIR